LKILSSVSILNTLYLDEEVEGCYPMPMASTPQKGDKNEHAVKHALTPVSKRQSEPDPKRLHTSTVDTVTGTFLVNTYFQPL
jgi:hypothetical protein